MLGTILADNRSVQSMLRRDSENQNPEAILRCLKMRGGTVAVSCFQTWMAIKKVMRTPKMTSNAIIRPSFQAYFDPPHCRARRRHTILGRKQKFPRGSSCRNFCLIELPAVFGLGNLRTKTIIRIVSAPIGRFI